LPHGLDRFFQGIGNQTFDLPGRGAGEFGDYQSGLDGECRIFQLAQLEIGTNAPEDNYQSEDKDRVLVVHGPFGYIHADFPQAMILNMV
jgi:hypothetical protein